MKELDIKKILVPTDFSLCAWKAATMAVQLGAHCGASVHLLHVIDGDYTLLGVNTMPSMEDIIARLTEESCRLGQKQPGITITTAIEKGTITHNILKTTLDQSADLVVIGKGGYDENFSGTHVCEIVRKSPVPVLVVPIAADILGLKKILFPVRPLLSATGKYRAIRSLLSAGYSELTMLSMRDPECEKQFHTVTELARLICKRMEEDNIHYDMEYYFRDSHFAEHVLYFLKNRHFDIAVISAERETQSLEYHLSNYAQTIIQRCVIPVLVMYPDEGKGFKETNSVHQKESVIEI